MVRRESIEVASKSVERGFSCFFSLTVLGYLFDSSVLYCRVRPWTLHRSRYVACVLTTTTDAGLTDDGNLN